jgi:hypothetical protein
MTTKEIEASQSTDWSEPCGAIRWPGKSVKNEGNRVLRKLG